MDRMKLLGMLAFAGACAISHVAAAQAASPYAGQQSRAITSLSAEELQDYLDGKGMGLARAAELNGYPGPMHVLELAEPLELSADQRARTQALLATMRADAIAAGRELIDAEHALDELFRTRAVSEGSLERAMAEIGERQAAVRRVHLRAHLAQVEILRPEQIHRYAELRGYTSGGDPASHRHAPHGHGKH
jgi:hypothetical protein